MKIKIIIIGERSEPPSDKLGGEICIATRALVCIYLYIYAHGLTTVPCPRYMLRAQRGQLINIILRSPFNVLHSVLVGRAKRAPHWGVQSRFRVIYIYVSVVVQNAHAELRGQTRACSRSVWGD